MTATILPLPVIPPSDTPDPVREQELTEIGHALQDAGWTCHQMRAMAVLHPVWAEVASLVETDLSLRLAATGTAAILKASQP